MNARTVFSACSLLVASGAWSAGWLDTFNAIDPAWVTDRQEPHGFATEMFDGDSRLKISVQGASQNTSSTFYYTEGRQRSALISAPWSVTGQVYIDMAGWSDGLIRTDLWARTGVVGDETTAAYPIIGFIYNDPADPFNAASTAKTWRYRVWDADAGGWQTLATAVTDGWHDLQILGDGTSFQYFLDGNPVYTDNTIGPVTQLTTVFVQAYNFGGANDYSVYWDNIGAREVQSMPVPEPFTLGLAAAGLAVAARRRRR